MTTSARLAARVALYTSALATSLLAAPAAHASFFAGEALDQAADVLAWIVMIVVPIGGLWLFWLVHILPEKIAEQRKHPQAKAIQVLCLLSLVFGGMLWPLAWLWAYSKPVLYKMAYGTDVAEGHHGETSEVPAAVANPETAREEIERLRVQRESLEARLGREARG